MGILAPVNYISTFRKEAYDCMVLKQFPSLFPCTQCTSPRFCWHSKFANQFCCGRKSTLFFFGKICLRSLWLNLSNVSPLKI